MTRPGMWSHYDDGIVRGTLLRRGRVCNVCGSHTACIAVDGYNLPETVPWTATILALSKRQHEFYTVAVYLGLGCGCLAKFHRQAAHIKDKI